MWFGLAKVDLLVIVLYFLVVIGIGMWTARKVKTEEDYFIGGRKFGHTLLVFHWLCTGTHSDMPVVVAGACYKVGLGGIWYQWMWLFCTPFYWLIAPITRRLRVITTGDFFRERYSRGLEMLYTIIAIAFYIGFIAMVLQGAGITIAGATGMQVRLEHTIAVLSIISAIYVFAGGLFAAAYTDVLQGFLIIVLSVMLLPFGLARIGGLAALHDKLPASMLSPVAPPGEKEGNLFFIVMMSLVSLVGIVVQPHVLTATGSGKTELEARVGMCYGNFVKRFLTIAWAFTGVIGIMLFPDLARREEVWGRSVQVLLPAGFRGLMIAAMLAGITATETFMVVGSAIFTRNFYEHVVRGKRPEHYLLVGRIAAVGMLILGILFAFIGRSVAQILKPSMEIIAFIGASFWIGVYWRRANSCGAWAGVLGAIISWAVTMQLGWDAPQRIALFVPVEFLLTILVSLLTPPQPKEQLDSFFAKLHTSVADEKVGKWAAAAGPRKLINRSDFEIPKPDRVDILGFIIAWVLVGGLIGLYWWLARLGG